MHRSDPPAGLPLLEGDDGRSTAELLALQGAVRTDSIVSAIERGIAARAARVGLHRLTGPERTVLAVEALEREVNHDGFVGFFTVAAEQAAEVVVALEAIGRPDVALLVRRALDELSIGGPPTPASIAAAMDASDDARDARLDACDLEYYAAAVDLAEPVLAYVRSHADQIALC